jgi:hypothetical protein
MPAKRQRSHIPGHSTEAETAEEFGCSIRTLRNWRKLRSGPPFVKVARQIHYPDAPRADWLKSQQVNPLRTGAKR